MSEAFRPLIAAAEKAKVALARSAQQTTAGRVRESKRSATEEARAYQGAMRQLERWEREKVRAVEKSSADRARAIERASREEVRLAQRTAREKSQAEEREQAKAERAMAKRAANRERFLGAHQNLRAATRIGGRAARAALNVAGDVARGAGVQTNIGNFIGNEVELEKRATDLTNASFMPGQSGANGRRQDPKALIAQMRQIGNATAMDPGKALEGLQKFVAKTGDLQTGRDVLEDMARYARASGAELDDMVDAAGDVKNALGPNGGPEQIKSVMKAIAAQGKEGAVEIKDLATQMAKLAAASSQFEGEGDFVMAQMGALTQMTRAKGGAASATQAATSVSSFTNTFSKGARLDAFKNFGVDVRGSSGKIDLKKVILGSIQAASSEKFGGMSQFDRNMGKMFMDVRARSATKGFETTFKEAGGGAAGLAAVEKALDDLSNATMNEKEVAESFAKSMNTTEAKVQLFNNEMSKTANEMKDVLLPAFQALGPLVIATTKGMVSWLSKLTKQEDVEAQKKQFSVETRALNAKADLGRAMDKGSVDSEEMRRIETEAAEAKKELEAEVTKKAQKLQFDKQQYGLSGKLSGDEEDAFLQKKAGEGSDMAARLMQDKEALARMQDTIAQLSQRGDDVAEKLEKKTLKVTIVGDTRAPELTLDAIGRTPSPEVKAAAGAAARKSP